MARDNAAAIATEREAAYATFEDAQRAAASSGEQTIVIPVVREEAVIERRTVVRGRVRVSKQVREVQEVVDEPLVREDVQVERVPVGKMVDMPPAVRTEGGVTIIPVVAEVWVIEKRFMLQEEVRITRTRSEERSPQSVTLRRDEVTIERV